MARPAVPAPAPNAITGVLLRLNALDVDANPPSLAASCERALRALADVATPAADLAVALEGLAASALLKLERVRADERGAQAQLAVAA